MNQLSVVSCRSSVVALVAVALLAGSQQASAAGFGYEDQSASALGVANAFVAQAGDVSAAYWNPAGIAWQPGRQAMLGQSIGYQDGSVRIPAGIAPDFGAVARSPYFYASWMGHESDWGASLAYARVFSHESRWPNAFNGAADMSNISSYRLSADLVHALNSDLALAGGIDWFSSTLTQTINSAPLATAHGKNNKSFSGHLAARWHPTPGWFVGATLHKGAKIKFGGNNSGQIDLTLPDDARLGLACDLSDRWRWEADAAYTRWSQAELNVRTAAGTTISTPLQLKDTVDVMTGVTWYWRENAQLRAGYGFEQGSASKGAGFNPGFSEQGGHRLSLGVGADVFDIHWDVGYAYRLTSSKTLGQNTIYAGEYKQRRQSLSLSASSDF